MLEQMQQEKELDRQIRDFQKEVEVTNGDEQTKVRFEDNLDYDESMTKRKVTENLMRGAVKGAAQKKAEEAQSMTLQRTSI